MAAATEAQQSGNYTLARQRVETAYMLIVALPDSEFERERLEWDREGLAHLLEYLQARINATATDACGNRGTILRPVDVIYERG